MDIKVFFYLCEKILTLKLTCYIITITDKQHVYLKGSFHVYIQLDFESNDPIYTQLKEQIIAGIAKKELNPGDALPSVRAMAKDIGINLHTVNKAYQQLKQEGYILIHRQKGVVIHPDGVKPADDAYRAGLKKTLYPLIAESVCKSISKDEFATYVSDVFAEFEKEKGGDE